MLAFSLVGSYCAIGASLPMGRNLICFISGKHLYFWSSEVLPPHHSRVTYKRLWCIRRQASDLEVSTNPSIYHHVIHHWSIFLEAEFHEYTEKLRTNPSLESYLSICAALKTTSNSSLSSWAAFCAISAASRRRESSSKNWPETEIERGIRMVFCFQGRVLKCKPLP